ncbi:lysophospholipid acyltransferase family protein [Sulfurimonas sp. C5]|uniref:lysophospholipid acyltransferase family protein n=1 Tax=Sulfurimonas sp. C5 TaxID=3036947 RepID=UPI0024554DE7|nr:lysophospholipid acyltransferase family protein [Sulfurimonas sp. C5]MDH4945200.1 lysophospholipid acyltransferase family protein [Sulfurimonas sp. C5]
MSKKLSRFLALIFIPLLGSLLIRILYYSNKKVFHGETEIPDEPVLIACWHGELLMLPYIYFHYREQTHVKALISPHFDGQLISKTLKYFQIDTLAGSSDKNPAKALIQAIRFLKEGYDIGITPDGPKGPRHEVADGVIVMAQKTKAKVLLVEIKPSKYWQFNSWDRFTVPKPFGTIHYYTSIVDLDTLDFEAARAVVQEGLLKHEH